MKKNREFVHMTAMAHRHLCRMRGQSVIDCLELNSRRACNWEHIVDYKLEKMMTISDALNMGADCNLSCVTCSMLKEEVTS